MKSLFLLLLLIFSTLSGRERIAITFDDFPMFSTELFEKEERVDLYLEKLDRLGIQTVFFCIGEQIDASCLEKAVAHQQLLANHSMHHLHLSELSLEAFREEVQNAEELLLPYSTFRSWYRFPYLDFGDRVNSGGSRKKQAAALQALKEMGYSHGYATINTFDWYVNHLMLKAIKKNQQIDFEEVKSTYLTLLEEWIDRYHASWKRSLKESFCHVLLLHQNDLNLLFLEDIVQMIRDKGWEIVSPDEAFSCPVRALEKFGSFPKFKHPPTLSPTYIDHFWNLGRGLR